MTIAPWSPQPAGPEPRIPKGPFPWGPMSTLIGFGIMFAVIFLVSIVLVLTWAAFDAPGVVQDAGGPLEQAINVAEYGHERAQAIAGGADLPTPPDLMADITSMRIAFGLTILQQILFVVIAVAVAGVGWKRWVHGTGLHWYQSNSIWRPIVGAIVIWAGVAVWGIVTQLIGIDILIPESTVPFEVQRDLPTLAIVGLLTVIGAPISEEFLFRGLIFGGLTRWGFWPAALISGLAFSAIHFDPGSLIPFMIVGMVLSWLFWHRGTLWDAIICHAIFNGVSFSIMLIGALSYD